MTKILSFCVLFLFTTSCLSQQFDGLNLHLGNLYRTSKAVSRSISPENFTGEKGSGGMATLENGSARVAARELGQGWKVNPYVVIKPGSTFVMGEATGPGAIQHIWMTPTGNYRLAIFRCYWDGETHPSVEVPVGDFFAAGWGWGNEPQINSLAVCVNPQNGFNSYWQMPFRKKFKITMENRSDRDLILYYQINYTLTKIPKDAAYFHARFNRSISNASKPEHVILDRVKGKGQYVGTFLAHASNSPGWWGEGEVKFFIDGDSAFPTICGTGEEDYFCGSYGYEMRAGSAGTDEYTNFSTPYTGFYHVKDPNNRTGQPRFGEYRWHITDPIRFKKDLKVTIQALGWKNNGAYLPLEDDFASVAFWYQTEPHTPFPSLPSNDALIIAKSNPIKHRALNARVQYAAMPDERYNHSLSCLTDGKVGTLNFSEGGEWAGFWGNDLEATLELNETLQEGEISIGFLANHPSWIFLPTRIEYLVSENGRDFTQIGLFSNEVKPEETAIKYFKARFNKPVRFIKIKAKNTGICPSWHSNAGEKAWLFVDEVVVE